MTRNWDLYIELNFNSERKLTLNKQGEDIDELVEEAVKMLELYKKKSE